MKPPASTQDYPDEVVAAAKAIIISMLRALKVLPLYPEDHTHCQKAMEGLRDDLETFLNRYQEIVFHVQKTRLLFEGEVVYQGEAKDGDLAFILFRDGMLSLVFQRGIEPKEMNEFLRILDRHKNLPDEPESDIITALWEADLPHVQYDAVDNIMETLQEGESSTTGNSTGEQTRLIPSKDTETFMHGEAHDPKDTLPEADNESKDLPGKDETLLKLVTDEKKDLQEMVHLEEEEESATKRILKMMTDILLDQQKQEFFDVALEYIEEELQGTLQEKNFGISLQILITLHKIRQLCKASRSWARSRISRFFLRVAGPDFLTVLQDVWSTVSASEIEKARKVLLLLPPKAGGSLGPMLLESHSPSVREMLSDVIVSLASRDFRPFEKLLDKAEEDLLHCLVPLLGRMENEESTQILFKMVQYPSERIRHEALKAVIARDLWVPSRLISLMDDENIFIRQLLIKYLGSRRSEESENTLIEYLQNRNIRTRDSDHLSTCFRALGRCGTARSIPFLRDTLLGDGWISRFLPSACQHGAAIALAGLGMEEAKQVLEEASRSRYPGIRNAALSVTTR